MTPITRYRATGADLAFGQPTRAHRGVAMEGYFWRLTDPDTGRVLIALCGANQGPAGPWATIGLAGSNGFVRTDARPGSWTDPHRLGVRGGPTNSPAFSGDEEHLRVNLGPDARLDLSFHDLTPWPHQAFGGSSVFQMIPGLNQYWHPWLLGGRASGTATLGEETWEFTDAQVYGEKNWGREGFPESWWWGQAQGFAEPEACVAFAGGLVTAGPMKVEVTGLVVKLPDSRVFRLGNPVISPVTTRTTDDTWELTGRGYGWKVEISASAPLADAHVLPVPLPSEHRNVPGDLEHLTGDLEIEVSRFGRHVWSGQTSLAALEHGGLERAAAELRRRGLDPTQPDAPPVEGR
ncbi:MAG: tocopherol cyclase family protein [Corynebacterium sp.]|uniref:tocopherol cyclase family protein n=1 Tax=Corynebacterium sp. TaxID=1720 RepID=UPI0026DF324E|nr:tocopherol cyclase family protein [Corynebacterium sp.]MDO5668602.1 tocopherol cyclase family protein [Corynebacterium sp.]